MPGSTHDEQWTAARRLARQAAYDEWAELQNQRLRGGLPPGYVAAIDERQLELEQSLDNYRQNLPEHQKAQYDRWVSIVSRHPGIVVDRLGVDLLGTQAAIEADFTENLVDRGVAASTFMQPGTLESSVIDSDGNTMLNVTITAFSHGNSAVHINANNEIATSPGFAIGILLDSDGDNLFVHEYAHVLQDGPINVPPEATDPNQDYFSRLTEGGQRAWEAHFHSALVRDTIDEAINRSSDEGRQLDDFLRSRFGEGYTSWAPVEQYATIANLFYQFPDDLETYAPELYQMMVFRTGQDPLAND